MKKLASILLAMLLCMSMVACGGKDNEADNADAGKEQLVVATNAAFEPFEYTEGDKYLGIDMEIAALLAEELGMELVIQNMDFDAVCLSVGQQKCDIAMAGLTINEERKEYVTFTDSYYEASQKLVVPETETAFDACTTAEEVVAILNGLTKDDKIGVQQGTTGQFYVEGDADWGFDGLASSCQTYKNGSLAMQDMLNGNIKYVIIDAAPADAITAAINEMSDVKAKVIDIDLTSELYAFGVDKNQPELLEKTNAFIQKITSDGTLESICDKYFGDGEKTPVTSAPLK